MKLIRLTDRIWYYPYEAERDRPNLGYVRGDKWSLAVDAGHSALHTGELYRALNEAGLPQPEVTVLTHWHWDHTFGMHAVHGLCVSGERTKQHLIGFKEKLRAEGTEMFFAMHESIRREYASGQDVVVTLPDMVCTGELTMDLGVCSVRLFGTESPHTDDSTLVFVPEERVLFMGDAEGGVFPTWEKDPALCQKLADTVLPIDAGIVLESHWEPVSKPEFMRDLMEDALA